MLDEYYAIRGWDGEGKPKAETLERLGIGKW
jgi:aldehyde:ferredoxin oxidoreductase